jgi:uncharacterized protein (DUF1778 family)
VSRLSARSEKIDIRVTPDAKRVIQEAAREKRTTISQFVLDTALSAAREILVERNHIALNAEQWKKFIKALDAPPRSHPRMQRLLNEPTILD